MILWTGHPREAPLTLPDPQGFELSFPADTEPQMTQSGFFVPIGAPDDAEGVVSVNWDALTDGQIRDIAALGSPRVLSISDPFGLNLRGYIKNLDHQTVNGRVAPDGGVMYAVQIVVQLTSVRWPDVIGMPPASASWAPGDRFGISASGQLPVQVTGEQALHSDQDGWLECAGGDTEPWGPVVPPVTGDTWNRSPRTRISPIHGVRPAYLAVDGTQLPPQRGSVFLAMRPLNTEPVEYPT